MAAVGQTEGNEKRHAQMMFQFVTAQSYAN